MQLQRHALSPGIAHPAKVGFEGSLRPLARRFPIDEFYNQKAVSFRKAPLARHLEVGEGGVERLEAEESSEIGVIL